MVIPNAHLNEVAKAMSGDSFVTPLYYGFSSTLTTTDVTDTSMTGEYGSRLSITRTRSDNINSYTTIKTGALVSTSGETIKGVAMFSASTSGTLMTETAIPTINQTNSFDIEFVSQITYDRS